MLIKREAITKSLVLNRPKAVAAGTRWCRAAP
jgi:hypothetical protein